MISRHETQYALALPMASTIRGNTLADGPAGYIHFPENMTNLFE